jgi:hypothetical protein
MTAPDSYLCEVRADAASALCMVGPHATKRHPEAADWLAELDGPMMEHLLEYARARVPDAERVFPETYGWSWMRKYAAKNVLDLGALRGRVVLLDGPGRTTVFEVDRFVRENAKASLLGDLVNRTTTKEERKEECPKVSCTFALCSEDGEEPTRSTLVRLVGTRPGKGTLKVDKSRLWRDGEPKPNEKATEVSDWVKEHVPDPSVGEALSSISSKVRLRDLLRPLARPMVRAIQASAAQHKTVYDLWRSGDLSEPQSRAVKGASLLKHRTDVSALASCADLEDLVVDCMVVPEFVQSMDRYFKVAVPEGGVRLSGSGAAWAVQVIPSQGATPFAAMDAPVGVRTCVALAARGALMDRCVVRFTNGLIAMDSHEWKRGVPGEAYMRLLQAVVDADKGGRVALIATDDPDMAGSELVDERVRAACVDERGNVGMRGPNIAT